MHTLGFCRVATVSKHLPFAIRSLRSSTVTTSNPSDPGGGNSKLTRLHRRG
jgi:hypothetical protein